MHTPRPSGSAVWLASRSCSPPRQIQLAGGPPPPPHIVTSAPVTAPHAHPARTRTHTHTRAALQVAAELGVLKPLLEGVEKRAKLLADKLEYEAIIANPARLLAKSSSSE